MQNHPPARPPAAGSGAVSQDPDSHDQRRLVMLVPPSHSLFNPRLIASQGYSLNLPPSNSTGPAWTGSPMYPQPIPWLPNVGFSGVPPEGFGLVGGPMGRAPMGPMLAHPAALAGGQTVPFGQIYQQGHVHGSPSVSVRSPVGWNPPEAGSPYAPFVYPQQQQQHQRQQLQLQQQQHHQHQRQQYTQQHQYYQQQEQQQQKQQKHPQLQALPQFPPAHFPTHFPAHVLVLDGRFQHQQFQQPLAAVQPLGKPPEGSASNANNANGRQTEANHSAARAAGGSSITNSISARNADSKVDSQKVTRDGQPSHTTGRSMERFKRKVPHSSNGEEAVAATKAAAEKMKAAVEAAQRGAGVDPRSPAEMKRKAGIMSAIAELKHNGVVRGRPTAAKVVRTPTDCQQIATTHSRPSHAKTSLASTSATAADPHPTSRPPKKKKTPGTLMEQAVPPKQESMTSSAMYTLSQAKPRPEAKTAALSTTTYDFNRKDMGSKGQNQDQPESDANTAGAAVKRQRVENPNSRR